MGSTRIPTKTRSAMDRIGQQYCCCMWVAPGTFPLGPAFVSIYRPCERSRKGAKELQQLEAVATLGYRTHLSGGRPASRGPLERSRNSTTKVGLRVIRSIASDGMPVGALRTCLLVTGYVFLSAWVHCFFVPHDALLGSSML